MLDSGYIVAMLVVGAQIGGYSFIIGLPMQFHFLTMCKHYFANFY